MQGVTSIKKVLVCERAVQIEEFRIFGVVQCFENLGWEASLKFNNNNLVNVYMKEIMEWMATLRQEEGNNPPRTTRLIGTSNGKEKPSEAMGTKLLKSNLKVLPKLLSLILGFNVIPRLGDKFFVRNFEIRVLHALMTGQPKLSFRHLVLLNVWESRVSRMRLATFGWIYRERLTEYVLKDDKTRRQLVVPKEGVQNTKEHELERGEPEGAGGSYQMRRCANAPIIWRATIIIFDQCKWTIRAYLYMFRESNLHGTLNSLTHLHGYYTSNRGIKGQALSGPRILLTCNISKRV
ncbi:hypothetical protein R6Q57_014849 [Mikania cordata]